MSSITSFTLRLLVREPVAFQSFSGFASCGIFYSLISSVDEGLADSLHSSKRLAPWSATPLITESSPPRIVFRRIPAPSILRLSFSIMDDRLCRAFREAILKPGLHVNLVNARAQVIGVAVNTYRFSELASGASPLPSRFTIRFLTPTAFRRSVFNCCRRCPRYVDHIIRAKSGERAEAPCEYARPCRGVVTPLPIPAMLLRSAARIWSTFSDRRLDARGAAEWAEEAIMVAGFPKGIRTARVYEHPNTNKWIIGFMGAVRFSIREDLYEERYARAAAALLKMAEITNVGVRRTAGLGMIRYLPSGQDINHEAEKGLLITDTPL